MAQIDQCEEHPLVRVQFAPPAAAGAAPAPRLGLLLPVASGDQFGQGRLQEEAERGGFQSEQGADSVFGKGVQLLKVHGLIFGQTRDFPYFTEYLVHLVDLPAHGVLSLNIGGCKSGVGAAVRVCVKTTVGDDQLNGAVRGDQLEEADEGRQLLESDEAAVFQALLAPVQRVQMAYPLSSL